MRNKILLFCGLFLGLIVSGAYAQEKSRKSIRTLIIDPGHGGMDPGAVGTMATEANVALQVSLKLGDTLRKAFPEMNLIYTRTTDILPGNSPNKDAALKYRANLANQSGGDLFISVHCNSAGRHAGGWYERRVVGKTPHTKTVKKGKKSYKKTYYTYTYETVYVENKARGTETYIWAMNKNDAKINSVTKNNEYTGEIDSTSTLALPDPSDPTEKARMLIYAQYYFRKSLNLANYVQEEFKDAGRIDRGVKQRNDKGIWVLQATGMPSILIEIGFISNTEEEQYLISEAGQQEVVTNIFNAIKKYKEKLEDKDKDADKEKKAF
jgi:N-acetylmuramoyl-L-alanine amidase